MTRSKLKFNLTNKIIYSLSLFGLVLILGVILFFISHSKKNESKITNKTVELEKPKTSKKQEGKQLNFFKLLLVFIISFVAFILIVDTFLVQISEYFPFAEKYLDNLYQSIIDISLFFQNLIK